MDPLDVLSARIGRSLRARRIASGMSMSELARASGLSKTIIGRIEAGSGNPSVETLWRIAHALAIPLGSLLAEEPEPRVRFVRARTGARLHADSGMQAWLVHAEGREHRSELFELSLPAGTEQRTGAHLPGTREVVVCIRGQLRAGPLGEEADLGPGDAVWFAADAPHRYVGLRDARALNWVLYGG